MRHSVWLACACLLAMWLAGTARAAAENLVIYTPHPLSLIEPIVKEFESASNIKVEIVPGSSAYLLKRIETENGNPLCDLLWGGYIAFLTPYSKYFDIYNTPERLSFFEEVKIPDGRITSFTLVSSVLMCNPDRLRGVKVEGYADLLNPALKGKIAFCDPGMATSAFAHLVNMLYAMGKGDPEKGWGYVDAFAANLDGKLLSSPSEVFTRVASGEYAVGLTFEGDGAMSMSKKLPVTLVYMAEGVISRPHGSAVVKGARNRENARRFIDFISSKPIQNLLATTLHQRPVRTDVPPGEGLLPMEKIHRIVENPDIVQKNEQIWIEKFKDHYTNY